MTLVVAKQIIEALSIRSVYLRSHNVALDDRFEPFVAGIKLDVQLRHQTIGPRIMTAEVAANGSQTSRQIIAFDIDVASRFLFSDASRAVQDSAPVTRKNVPQEPLVAATITARFSAIYELGDGASMSEEELVKFGKSGPLFHIWPYWRELLHSTCGRIGVVPVVLPMLVSKSKAATGDRKIPSPSKGAKKKRGVRST